MNTITVAAVLSTLTLPHAALAYVPANDVIPISSINYQDESQIAAILQVLESYKKALKNSDRKAFRALFHDEKSPIYGIYIDDESSNTETYPHDSSFINRFIENNQNASQDFWNVDVRVDGLVAVLNADFSFFVDDKKTNWGTESWHLIKTKDGWKILSIIYSVKPK